MQRRTCLVEFGFLGHHADYLDLLVDAWRTGRPPGAELVLAVTPGFVRFHAELAARIRAAGADGMMLHVLDQAAYARLKRAVPPRSLPIGWLGPAGPPEDSAPRVRWDVAADLVRATGAGRLFLMDLDAVLPALAARLALDVPVSGIVFRSPCADDDMTAAHRRWLLHQRTLVKAAAAHPRLERMLVLDPRAEAEDWVAPFRAKITTLVDPVPVRIGGRDEAGRAAARRRLGIAEGRRAVLQFGHMAARKGHAEVLAALADLPRAARERLSFLMFGARVKAETVDLETAIERVAALGVQTVWADRFVDEDLAGDLFAAADVVTVIYRNHAGMSGVLLRAAAAGVPVIAQATGLIGHLVRRHRLGRTVDPARGEAIASALLDVLDGDFDEFDRSAAQDFARAHDPSRFKAELLEALFPSDP